MSFLERQSGPDSKGMATQEADRFRERAATELMKKRQQQHLATRKKGFIGGAAKKVGKGVVKGAKAVGSAVVAGAKAIGSVFSSKKGGQGGFNPMSPRYGAYTFRDHDRTDDQVEKDQEFTTMYKDFMDAMDDVCFHDLPKDFTRYCKYMYFYGDRVVEMYLHDYEDYEICSQIPMQCTPTFFTEGSKSLWR